MALVRNILSNSYEYAYDNFVMWRCQWGHVNEHSLVFGKAKSLLLRTGLFVVVETWIVHCTGQWYSYAAAELPSSLVVEV